MNLAEKNALSVGQMACTREVLTNKIAECTSLSSMIAECTQLKPKKVAQVFAALRTIAYAEAKKTKKFVIPKLLTLELKHKPARKARTKVMFGRELKVAAKPASKVVRALPAKALKDSI